MTKQERKDTLLGLLLIPAFLLAALIIGTLRTVIESALSIIGLD